MSLFRYFNRALAFVVLAAFAIYSTSLIGTQRTCPAFDWAAAWSGVYVVAVVLIVGFMAGRESKEPKP